MATLSLDLDDPAARPYFLWSESTTIGELREILADRQDPRRPYYVARLMREASVPEAWRFISPTDIRDAWADVAPHLGRRRRFWEYLVEVWKKHGAI